MPVDDYAVTIELPMRWGDMDALGHANNARYFTWFESVRIEYFQRLGLRVDKPREIGPILATTTCDFLRPVTWPAQLVVGARVPRLGNTSFTMEYALAVADAPDELCARGSGVIVLVDYLRGTKVPIPDDLRAAIEELG